MLLACDVAHVGYVLPGKVRKLGDQSSGECAIAGVLDAAEVSAGDVQEGQVEGCFWMIRVMDDQVEKDHESGDWSQGDDPDGIR